MGFSRGMKLGDPLFPTLFRIVAEALSIGLNALNGTEYFKRFGVPKWSSEVNHFAYADNIILFTSADRKSMKLMIKALKSYEAASRQLINLEKSFFFYVHEKVAPGVISSVKTVTQIKQGSFTFTYVGSNLMVYFK